MGDMWGVFQNIGQLVSRYSTVFGQFWYLLTFVFRLMVVVALGGSVYSDEKGSFTCITTLPACGDQCYNTYAKISHMRFWSFQLLAVTFPAVLFHFYSNYISGEVEKLKMEEEELKKTEEKTEKEDRNVDVLKSISRSPYKTAVGDVFQDLLLPNANKMAPFQTYDWDHHRYKQQKRERKLGKVRMKKVFNEGSLKEVPITRKIKLIYYVSVALRAAIEAFFIYYATALYNYVDENCRLYPEAFSCPYLGTLSFIWMTVPTQFTCSDPSVQGACSQHFTQTSKGEWAGNIVCYISRPFEKTIFLRYMQILACVCFILCIAEIVFIPIRELTRHKKGRLRKENRKKSELEMDEERAIKMTRFMPNEVQLVDEYPRLNTRPPPKSLRSPNGDLDRDISHHCSSDSDSYSIEKTKKKLHQKLQNGGRLPEFNTRPNGDRRSKF